MNRTLFGTIWPIHFFFLPISHSTFSNLSTLCAFFIGSWKMTLRMTMYSFFLHGYQTEKQTISPDICYLISFSHYFFRPSNKNRMYNFNWKQWIISSTPISFQFHPTHCIFRTKFIIWHLDDNLYFYNTSGLNVAHCDDNASKCFHLRLFGSIKMEFENAFFSGCNRSLNLMWNTNIDIWDTIWSMWIHSFDTFVYFSGGKCGSEHIKATS